MGIDFLKLAESYYEDALKQYESLKNPSFKLVKVEEFKDAINALKEDLGE